MYATEFTDGSKIDSYLAVAYAEGFQEPPTKDDELRAWSYLCGTKLGYSLQGWFGRSIHRMIESGILDTDGTILI
jgi:hypothetical protein